MLLIDRIRKHASAWYTKVFLAVLALCFVVLWGGGDMLRQGILGEGQNVLTVGGKTISAREFSQELLRGISRYEAQSGQRITLAEAKKIGLFGQVLRGLVQRTLMDLECERMGLVVSDKTVRDMTRQNPLFRDENGDFIRSRFNQFLQSLNVSEARYVREVRGDLRRAQLMTAISTGINPPDSLVKRLFNWQNEERQVRVYPIKAAAIKKVPNPKEEDLKEFWEKNPGKIFTESEYRSFTAISFGPKDVKVEIDPNEIQKIYESRKDTDFEGKSLMQVSQAIEAELLPAETEKALENLRGKIEDLESSGKTLKEIADQFKLTLIEIKDINLKGKLKTPKAKKPKSDLLDLMVETAFNTDADDISDTIQTSTGEYILVYVDGVTPSKKMAYEISKDLAKKQWKEARKLVQAEDNAKAIVEKINKGDRKALKGLKSKLITVRRFENDASKKAGITSQFLGRIFTLNKKQKATQMISIADPGSLVVVLDKVIPGQVVKNKEKSQEEVLKEFKARIRDMLISDVMEQYLATLQQRYRVEINQKALQAF